MNYEFNLLHHVGVVAKRVRAAAAETAHEGDDETPSGQGVKKHRIQPTPPPPLVVMMPYKKLYCQRSNM